MRYLYFSTLLLCSIGSFATSASAAQSNYSRLFQRECSACHGKKADKPAFNKAPPLITLDEQQIIHAMTVLRDSGDTSAAARAKAHLTDEQIKGFAGFIQTLKAE